MSGPWLFAHHHSTPGERAVLLMVGDGLSDTEIAAALEKKVRAIRATLHRFYERTDLGHRKAPLWANYHRECCLGSREMIKQAM